MPLRELLSTHYNIQIEEKIWLHGKEGYRQDNQFYFTTTSDNKEVILMEQAALAYYLMENDHKQITMPIPNLYGEWFSSFADKSYMVFRVEQLKQENRQTEGKALAMFHQLGSVYRYEPKNISSYGAWKALWIEKLTVFETKIEQEAKLHPTAYYRLLMDSLPYLIGISENAIQYIQESEGEQRFHEVDQGTITFNRYSNQLHEPIIWSEDLVYDHPVRDIAEYIRRQFLMNEPDEKVTAFLFDYQESRPLSVFSWRLIYGRLLYPIPIFDLISRGFVSEDFDQLYIDLATLLEQQTIYEKRLRGFYQSVGVDSDTWNIPVVQWLM
ncbi:hypothetical protein [Oceanobacillus chungangensis]|uniref:Spore coat protein YutH n=1 Tax=Oceanobacillus chungangensis TaxID=1229152 RepID=A0A3D8PXY5_9BACI|nr:hypothetical protein [Oceanobacillus chungangensis]RDW20953.1 hypothetical protein CWR45_03645 [Oceanobacillus chungangensis]